MLIILRSFPAFLSRIYEDGASFKISPSLKQEGEDIAKEQAKIAAEKELALEELELKAQQA